MTMLLKNNFQRCIGTKLLRAETAKAKQQKQVFLKLCFYILSGISLRSCKMFYENTRHEKELNKWLRSKACTTDFKSKR